MSNRTITLTDELYEYLLHSSLQEPEILWRLRQETRQQELAVMQISPEQGQFLSFLLRVMGARRAIEVGVYTGYSSLCIAMALPKNGQLIACDINREWTDIAQRYWQEAGVTEQVDLYLAPAIKTLTALLDDGQQELFDFAFIDADKTSYLDYYEACLKLVRPGGIVAIDNVLWGGSVVDENNNDNDTVAIRQFNEFLKSDERVDISMLPIGDGLTLARRKDTC